MANAWRVLTVLSVIAATTFSIPRPGICALRIVPDLYATIQLAFNAAVSGDSIMVRAGTYVESLAFAGKDVTLFGEAGQGATFLTTNATSRVVTMGAGITQATVLSDLTIRNGLADEGGGILLASGASPVLRRCRLLENTSYRPTGSTWGGAIRVGNGSQLLVEDCIFHRNLADYFCCFPPGEGNGGAISAASGSTIRVVRTNFVDNGAAGFEGGFGGAIEVGENATAVIEDSSFRGNGGYGGGVGSGGHVTIERCTFAEHVGYTGAAVYTYGGRAVIRSNIFVDNLNWGESGAVYIGPSDVPGEFIGNTVAFNQGEGIYIWRDVARNNIIASNDGVGLTCSMQQPGDFSCNDVWNNAPNYGCADLTGIDGNISLDPLFCNAAIRDLHLHQNSPCAPGSGACGLIGALDVECGVTGVEPGASAAQPLRLLIEPNPLPGVGGTLTLVGGNNTATIAIINAQGRVVERIGPLVDGRIAWVPGPGIAAGVYFARVEALGKPSVTKFAIIR